MAASAATAGSPPGLCPNYAVICSFLERYGALLDLPELTFPQLERYLQDTSSGEARKRALGGRRKERLQPGINDNGTELAGYELQELVVCYCVLFRYSCPLKRDFSASRSPPSKWECLCASFGDQQVARPPKSSMFSLTFQLLIGGLIFSRQPLSPAVALLVTQHRLKCAAYPVFTRSRDDSKSQEPAWILIIL